MDSVPCVKPFPSAILAIIITAAGIAFYRCRLHPRTADNPAAEEQASPAKRESGQRLPIPTAASPIPTTTGEPQSTAALARTGKVLALPGLPPVLLERAAELPWKKRIDAITSRADLSDTRKAKSLIEMLADLPEQAIVEAAHEAATRLPDADYRAVIRPTLIDPQTDTRVIAVLFADLMERPAVISLPILLSIAKESRHSYAPFAMQNLERTLGQNLGSDWTKWDAAIQNHIAIFPK